MEKKLYKTKYENGQDRDYQEILSTNIGNIKH